MHQKWTLERWQNTAPYTLLSSLQSPWDRRQTLQAQDGHQVSLLSDLQICFWLSLPAVVMMLFTLSVLRAFGPGNWLVVKRFDLHFLQKVFHTLLAQMMKVFQCIVATSKMLVNNCNRQFLISNKHRWQWFWTQSELHIKYSASEREVTKLKRTAPLHLMFLLQIQLFLLSTSYRAFSCKWLT